MNLLSIKGLLAFAALAIVPQVASAQVAAPQQVVPGQDSAMYLCYACRIGNTAQCEAVSSSGGTGNTYEACSGARDEQGNPYCITYMGRCSRQTAAKEGDPSGKQMAQCQAAGSLVA